MGSWNWLEGSLYEWQWVGMLLARLFVGLLFAISGGSKLFLPVSRDQMQKTLVAARVPLPAISAVVVSIIEFACGFSLVLGFMTPLSCLLLIGLMLGALVTLIVPDIQSTTVLDWLGEFFYKPEVLYVVILVWLLLSGPGWFSLDNFLFARR